MMDTNGSVPSPADTPATDAALPAGPVVVSVCVSCRADGVVVGPDLLGAVTAAMGADPAVELRAVQCLGVCKRPATVAVTSPDGYTFLFGDLQTASGAAALTAFVAAYRVADYGLVPWRARAEVLRKGMVARVPPQRWSPADGAAPKT